MCVNDGKRYGSIPIDYSTNMKKQEGKNISE